VFYVGSGLGWKGLVVLDKKTAKRLAKEFSNPQFETLDDFLDDPVIKHAISLMTDLQQSDWVFIEKMNQLIQSLPQVKAMKKRMTKRKIQGLKDLWAFLFSRTEAKN